MTRYLMRRIALSIVTLFILLIVVFLLTSVFPSDPARVIAGPFASEETYLDIRERIGADDPAIQQFGDLLVSTVTFDFGNSFELDVPVSDLLFPALGRSALLVAFALLLTVPLSIAGGILAARRKDTVLDRSIVTLGLASASIPEFVSGVILQYVIGVRLGWFPAIADAPDGIQLSHHPQPPGATGAGDRVRLLRLHRPCGSSRHGCRLRLGLRAHGIHEGPVEPRRHQDATSCATPCNQRLR